MKAVKKLGTFSALMEANKITFRTLSLLQLYSVAEL